VQKNENSWRRGGRKVTLFKSVGLGETEEDIVGCELRFGLLKNEDIRKGGVQKIEDAETEHPESV